MNESVRKQIDPNALFSGLVLIAIGTLFLLDRMDVVNFGWMIGHWWPMFIVGFGISHMLKGRVWSGMWMVAIGLWFEAIRFRVFGLRWSTGWPFILIAMGAATIVRALIDASRRNEPPAPENRS